MFHNEPSCPGDSARVELRTVHTANGCQRSIHLKVCVCLCVSDPTAGPSASDQSTWYLDESTLSDNIKKTLHKFCGPSPVVFRYENWINLCLVKDLWRKSAFVLAQ